MNMKKMMTGVAFALIACVSLPDAAFSALTRFVRITKNELPDTRLHVGELEAFANLVVPNNLGGATFGGQATSTNDITSIGVHVATTTSSLEHGGGNTNPNNLLENGGAVWSTNNGLGVNARYTLDLGGTFDVTTIRAWPRADSCCANRWQNLVIDLLGDNGLGQPGAIIASQSISPTSNVPLNLTFAAAPAIPEPSSLILLSSLAVFGVAGRRFRSRA